MRKTGDGHAANRLRPFKGNEWTEGRRFVSGSEGVHLSAQAVCGSGKHACVAAKKPKTVSRRALYPGMGVDSAKLQAQPVPRRSFLPPSIPPLPVRVRGAFHVLGAWCLGSSASRLPKIAASPLEQTKPSSRVSSSSSLVRSQSSSDRHSTTQRTRADTHGSGLRGLRRLRHPSLIVLRLSLHLFIPPSNCPMSSISDPSRASRGAAGLRQHLSGPSDRTSAARRGLVSPVEVANLCDCCMRYFNHRPLAPGVLHCLARGLENPSQFGRCVTST